MGTKRKPKTRKRNKTGKRLLFSVLVVSLLFALFLVFTPGTEPLAATGDTNLPEGIELPVPVPGEQIIRHTGYTLSYDEPYEVASYVAYQLTKDEVNGGLNRADDFRADPMVATGSATLNDYKGSGYDRGHLIPAADQKWSTEAMSDSFYMSNMTPQVGSFNRGIWGSLEAVVRTFANDNGAVYVVTGPVLTDGPYKTIGKNKVAVPKRFYKVVLFYDGKTAKAIGFLLPNEGSNKPVETFAVPVDEVEQVTGLDFYPALPDNIEESVEASFDPSAWDWKEFTPGDGPKTVVNGREENDKTEALTRLWADEMRHRFSSFFRSL
jgi:endonuclease G